MIQIAVLGYGTVGSGVVEVINTNYSSIAKKAGDEINIKYVLDLRDFPEDPMCWENESQYLYGPDILVAPVMERGEKQKEVYLPKGAVWTNVWTNEVWEGGQSVTVETPLDQMPLFTREGYTLVTE